MYCQYCGNEIKQGEKFCKHCGKPCFTNGTVEEKTDKIVPQEEQEVRCPYCGSTDIQVIVKTQVKGGGYSASNGCCGYLLLGPLGLLCGACGSDVKSTCETWWSCKKCGKEFLTPEATSEKLKKGVRSAIIAYFVCAFFAAACLAMDEDQIIAVIPAAVAAFFWYSVAKIPQEYANKSLQDFIDAKLYHNIISKYIWIGIVAFLVLTIFIKRLLWG